MCLSDYTHTHTHTHTGASQSSQRAGMSVGAFMPFATPNYAIPALDPRKVCGEGERGLNSHLVSQLYVI